MRALCKSGLSTSLRASSPPTSNSAAAECRLIAAWLPPVGRKLLTRVKEEGGLPQVRSASVTKGSPREAG